VSSLQSKSKCLAPPINRKGVPPPIRHHTLDSLDKTIKEFKQQRCDFIG